MTKVTRGSGNIFRDIGLSNHDEHLLRAKVAIFLGKLIEHNSMTQAVAAERMGMKQPDLSKILRGHLAGFSLERLLTAANALGADFEIKFSKPHTKRKGHAQVREYEVA